ncbi:MAG: hypothetical protein WCD18_02020 [Thermosynechococcaceae cyanobacterium]
MQTHTIPETVSWPTLPLAVYREVAAHLRQVIGLEVEILPQTASTFDYELSQVGGLCLRGASELSPESQKRALEILQYYGHRFGPWQVLTG